MPELRAIAPPSRKELLRGLAARLGDAAPGWQPLAEGILGASPRRIDFVGLQPGDRLTAVLVGDAEEDLELIARGLAESDWLTRRVPDWLQLSRDLVIRPDVATQAVLLCPAFRSEAVVAARAVGERLRLATYRWVRSGTASEPLIELLLADPGDPLEEDDPLPLEPVAVPAAAPARQDPARTPPGGAPESEAFRSGLRDEDLGLTPEELSELE